MSAGYSKAVGSRWLVAVSDVGRLNRLCVSVEHPAASPPGALDSWLGGQTAFARRSCSVRREGCTALHAYVLFRQITLCGGNGFFAFIAPLTVQHAKCASKCRVVQHAC